MRTGISSSAVLAVALAASGCSSSHRAPNANGTSNPKPFTGTDTVASAGTPAAPCHPPRVRYRPYPGHGEGLSQIPWVRGEPPGSGLVALLWYWPDNWSKEHLREARIFTGGVAPAGYNVKILWAFLAPSAKGRGGSELVVAGDRLNGSGSFRQKFAAIGYAGARGAPSYASIIDVPRPGCWRLTLTTGDLRASVDFRAVPGESLSSFASTTARSYARPLPRAEARGAQLDQLRRIGPVCREDRVYEPYAFTSPSFAILRHGNLTGT